MDVWGHDHEIIRSEWKCIPLQKTTTPLRYDKWQLGLIELALHHWGHGLQQFTPESQRLRLTAWCKELGTITKTVPHPSLLFLWKRNDEGHGWPTRTPHEQCISSLQHIHQCGAWNHSAPGATNLEAIHGDHSHVHLREVHYRLVIACDICKAYASMLVQAMSMSTTLVVRASCTTRSLRQKSRKGLPKANTAESCRVKGKPETLHPILLMNGSWPSHSELHILRWISAQSYKLSYFSFANTSRVLWHITFTLSLKMYNMQTIKVLQHLCICTEFYLLH